MFITTKSQSIVVVDPLASVCANVTLPFAVVHVTSLVSALGVPNVAFTTRMDSRILLLETVTLAAFKVVET